MDEFGRGGLVNLKTRAFNLAKVRWYAFGTNGPSSFADVLLIASFASTNDLGCGLSSREEGMIKLLVG